jgi:hypothetical protein
MKSVRVWAWSTKICCSWLSMVIGENLVFELANGCNDEGDECNRDERDC